MASVPIFGFIVGPGEIWLILALVVILYATRRFPDFSRGFNLSLFELRKAWRDFLKGLDDQTFDAGKTIGGIYGKPAAQALTPDNQTAELYDPAVLRDREKATRPVRKRILMWALLFLLAGIAGAILVVAYFKFAMLSGRAQLTP